MREPSVLIVEDDAALRDMLRQGLVGFDVRTAGSLDEAQRALADLPDVVLTDVHLGGETGLDLAQSLRDSHPRLPVIVMTAFGDLSVAIRALRLGAYDFLTKPLDLSVLRTALYRAAETHRLRREVRDLRRQVRLHQGFHDLVGASPSMQAIYKLIDRVAPAPSSVLIRGESGTGKELVARALHAASPRSHAPFVAVNCTAVPDALLESELFGHLRGSFTGAHQGRAGLFSQADGGTLFLDEIGDVPLKMQAKLLRALQERRIRPIGSDKDLAVDVRVVAATHRNLDAMVDASTFRDDLLYRLDVITVELPPLRDRGGDVLLLAQRFIEVFSARLGRNVQRIAPEAARQLLDYTWPGNVRELQNCIERAVVLCQYDTISLEDLPPKVAKARPHTQVLAVPADPVAMLPLGEVERRYVLQVLQAVGGRRAEAARVLQVDRKTLYRKLERWRHDSKE